MRDWVIALVTLIASLAVSGMMFAYGYGKLEQRVGAVEQWRSEIRAEWTAARERIERAVKEDPPRR
jgi:hypothetical protein